MTNEELTVKTAELMNEVAVNLGVVAKEVKDIRIETRENRQAIKEVKTDLEQYKELQKEERYISPSQQQELHECVKNRVSSLLMFILKDESIPVEDRQAEYKRNFGCFMRKCWNDSKRYADVLGRGGVYTKSMHFDKAKEYIGTWTPHGYGVNGYIEHLKMV